VGGLKPAGAAKRRCPRIHVYPAEADYDGTSTAGSAPTAHMKNRRNYYRILHVQSDAPTAVIKGSYRAPIQRLKMHPDLGGDHAQAVLINEELATLTDPEERAAYDRGPKRASDQRSAPSLPDPPRASRPAPRVPSATSPAAAACAFRGVACTDADADSPESVCATCGNPPFTARKHHFGGLSRRGIERLRRGMPVTFRLSRSRRDVWSGVTEDVTLNGMRFLSQVSIPLGGRLRIECHFCSAVALVRNVRSHGSETHRGWECGCEFLTLRIQRERGGLFSVVA